MITKDICNIIYVYHHNLLWRNVMDELISSEYVKWYNDGFNERYPAYRHTLPPTKSFIYCYSTGQSVELIDYKHPIKSIDNIYNEISLQYLKDANNRAYNNFNEAFNKKNKNIIIVHKKDYCTRLITTLNTIYRYVV